MLGFHLYSFDLLFSLSLSLSLFFFSLCTAVCDFGLYSTATFSDINTRKEEKKKKKKTKKSEIKSQHLCGFTSLKMSEVMEIFLYNIIVV